MKDQAKDVLEKVGERIVLKLKEQSFTIEGTPMATLKFPDGQFKNKPLLHGLEAFPSYAYVGAKGQLIFGFDPEDAQAWESFEGDAKKIDGILPLFGAAVAEAFGLNVEDLPRVVTYLYNRELEEVKAAAEREKQATEATYEAIPTFGMF